VRASETVFIDANIPMYLIGAPHPNRERAQSALSECIRRGDRLVTDAEALQEILHRYVAIERRDFIGPCLDTLLGVVDEVLPVTGDDVLEARRLLLEMPSLSARDAVHAAIMRRHGVRHILSFDRGFDAVRGLERQPVPGPR
jgi:predicted nucleic acid-binding protein